MRIEDKEYELFCKAVERSVLTKEAHLRHLINGLVPQDAPPPDYYKMMQQLDYIGNNLNQIARKTHALNAIDVQRYDEAYSEFQKAVMSITEAVLLPREMKVLKKKSK